MHNNEPCNIFSHMTSSGWEPHTTIMAFLGATTSMLESTGLANSIIRRTLLGRLCAWDGVFSRCDWLLVLGWWICLRSAATAATLWQLRLQSSLAVLPAQPPADQHQHKSIISPHVVTKSNTVQTDMKKNATTLQYIEMIINKKLSIEYNFSSLSANSRKVLHRTLGDDIHVIMLWRNLHLRRVSFPSNVI